MDGNYESIKLNAGCTQRVETVEKDLARYAYNNKSQKYSRKKHAKDTGGGPAYGESLSQMDQNVLDLIGSRGVDGHATVNESNMNFDWSDDAIEMEYEYLENEVTPEESKMFDEMSTPSTSAASTHEKENNCNIGNQVSREPEGWRTPLSSSDRIKPIANVLSNSKGKKKLSVAARQLEKSIAQTETLADISRQDCEVRANYYAQKLKLYKKELHLKEREVIATERISKSLEDLLKKNSKS